jgi:hypothetical protein
MFLRASFERERTNMSELAKSLSTLHPAAQVAKMMVNLAMNGVSKGTRIVYGPWIATIVRNPLHDLEWLAIRCVATLTVDQFDEAWNCIAYELPADQFIFATKDLDDSRSVVA